MAKGTTLLDKNKNVVFPRTILEQVYSKDGTNRLDNILRLLQANIESDIADTNLAVAQLREELDAFLSDATVSGEVRDAILEIKALLDSNSSDVVGELVATMAALRDEAVRNVAQTLTETQKSTARANIGAVGVSATYGDGLATLSYGGNAIFPETKGGQVKLSIGGNAEDAIKANGESIAQEKNRAIAREDEIAEGLAETKEKVDAFLADADTSDEAINKLKELQDYIKSDETSASQMLGDIAQNKQDIADNATNIEKEAARAKQTEMYLESQKADKSGYYENLSVGVSDNLSGRGEATESEFAMRPSGGENKSIPEDGTARINTIKGNSVVWNQLVNNIVSNDLGTTGWYVRQGNDKAVVSGNKITITFTSGVSDFPLLGQRLNLKSNRKYYIKITYEVPKLDTYNRALQVLLDSVYSGSDNYEVIEALNGYNNTKQTVSTICNGLDEKPYLIIRPRNSTNDVGEKMSCEVEVTDLTKMFNGVNEPTTVEEYEALYGNMPSEYNEGTIIDNHTTAIKSVGVNAWDEEWKLGGFDDMGEFTSAVSIVSKNFNRIIPNTKYYMSYQGNSSSTGAYIQIGFWDKNSNFLSRLYVNNREFTTPDNACYFKISSNAGLTPPIVTYKHDICIHLVHTGYLNGKYFPYESQTRQLPAVEGGLKSARTAYDEIRYNKSKDKWEHVQRVGSVDLGTLSWEYNSDEPNRRFVSRSIEQLKPVLLGNIPNLRCAKYISVGAGNTYRGVTGVSVSDVDNPVIHIYDPLYINSEPDAFKAAMQGVILYYELTEPVVTELDVDISPDYKVWDYGTEEAISEVLSTPIRINANYGFNAVGQITDNTVLIQELLARVAVLEAQLAQAGTNAETIEPVVK